MEGHSKITLSDGFSIWLVDKWNTFLNNKKNYLTAFIPSFVLLLGVIGDICGILKVEADYLTIILLSFLFMYGIINMIFVTILQRSNIRLNRIENYFELIHHKIVHQFRDYIEEREYYVGKQESMTSNRTEDYIKKMLKSFNESYIERVHRKNSIVTLKYKLKNKLYPIRTGNDILNRSDRPEELKNSFIYSALNKSRNKLKFIYVKNLHKPDKYEGFALGSDITNIQKRALNHYSTFIALPIRSGELSISTNEMKIRRDLGIIGFDLKKEYGFGNLKEHQIELICSFADLLSIMVKDLIYQKSIENGNN